MAARYWATAITALQQVQTLDSGYKEVARLLALAREEQSRATATPANAAPPPPQEQRRATAAPTNAPQPPAVNTSGRGKDAVVPEEIKGWNWGAFLLTGLWGLGNQTYIALLVLVPYAGWFAMPFVLGFKGNEWAWRNKQWESVEHFQRVQKTWARWGVGILVGVGVLVFMMMIFGGILASFY